MFGGLEVACIRDRGAPMSERVVLVDVDDAEVVTAGKLEAHRTGQLHRAFSVFVFDPAGAMLLQRRAAGKYDSAGRWSNACCGHPRPGEDTRSAARRRLREEMGIDCALAPVTAFTYRAEVRSGTPPGSRSRYSISSHEESRRSPGSVPG